jgi:hypothetical protein
MTVTLWQLIVFAEAGRMNRILYWPSESKSAGVNCRKVVPSSSVTPPASTGSELVKSGSIGLMITIASTSRLPSGYVSTTMIISVRRGKYPESVRTGGSEDGATGAETGENVAGLRFVRKHVKLYPVVGQCTRLLAEQFRVGLHHHLCSDRRNIPIARLANPAVGVVGETLRHHRDRDASTLRLFPGLEDRFP